MGIAVTATVPPKMTDVQVAKKSSPVWMAVKIKEMVSRVSRLQGGAKEAKEKAHLDAMVSELTRGFVKSTHIIQKLKTVTSTSPSHRTAEDILNIAALCSVSCTYFAEQTLSKLKKLCRVVQIESFKRGQVIMRGSTTVPKWSAVIQGAVSEKEVVRGGHMKKNHVYNKGEFFGDKLIENGPQGSMVFYAEQACELLTVNAETYSAVFQHPIEGIMDFLQENVRACSDWSDRDLEGAANAIMVERLFLNELVDNDAIDSINIVHKGTCRVYALPESQLSKLEEEKKNAANKKEQDHVKLVLAAEAGAGGEGEQNEIEEDTKVEDVEPERGMRQRKRGGDDKDAVTIKGKVEIGLLKPGMFFGEGYMMDGRDDYPKSLVICATEPVELYRIQSYHLKAMRPLLTQMLKEEGKFRMRYFMGRRASTSFSLKKNKEIGGLTSYQEAAIKYQASELLNPSPKSFSSLTGGADGEKERQPSKMELPKYTPFMRIKKGGGDAQIPNHTPIQSKKDTGPARFTAGEGWAGEGDRRDRSDRGGSTRASRTSISKQGFSPTRPKRTNISKQDNRPNRAGFGAQDDTRSNRISTSSQDTRPNRSSTSMQGMQEDPSRNRPSPSMQDNTHRRRPSTCLPDETHRKDFNTSMQEDTLKTVRPHTVPASIGNDFNSNRFKPIKRHSFTSIFQRVIPNEIMISLPPLKKDNEAEEYFKDLKPVNTNMVSRNQVIKDKIERLHEAGRFKLEYGGQHKLRLSAMHMKVPL